MSTQPWPPTVQQEHPNHVVQLWVPGNPVPKARPRLARGHVHSAPRTVEAEQRILSYLKSQYPRLRPVYGSLGVTLRFWIAATKKGERSLRQPDLDNLIKLVWDSFNGVVWHDDSQVDKVEATAFRWSPEPHTDIVVYRLAMEP